mgnify:CR=1 FL=1
MSEFCAFLAKISEETGCDARVATVSGRYWAMDRDNRWERIQRAYDVMVNASDADTDPVAGIKAYYEKDPRGDEFVEPFAAHNEGTSRGRRGHLLQLPSRSCSSDDPRVHGQGVRRL